MESRLLEILVHRAVLRTSGASCRMQAKTISKTRWMRSLRTAGVMKNKKNRFAVSRLRLCGRNLWLPSGHSRLSRRIIRRAKPSRMICSSAGNASGGAWHGDRVLVKVSERKNNRGRKQPLSACWDAPARADRRARAARQGIFRAADLEKVSGDCGGQA